MELEYKFALDDAAQGEQILSRLRGGAPEGARLLSEKRIAMDSTYFDTPDGALWKAGFALRLRRENDRQVCCLKYGGSAADDGLARRGELECVCESLDEGLSALAAQPLPQGFAALCAAGLTESAGMHFLRRACLVETGASVCELAFDAGYFGADPEKNRFYELELELKSGEEAGFHAFAAALVRAHALKPEKRPKLMRALEVGQK